MDDTQKILERKIKSLEKLEKSYAWVLINEALDSNVLQAAYDLGGNSAMSENDMHFRRGAISAARGFKQIIPGLLSVLKTDLMIYTSKLNDPAKAGQEKI